MNRSELAADIATQPSLPKSAADRVVGAVFIAIRRGAPARQLNASGAATLHIAKCESPPTPAASRAAVEVETLPGRLRLPSLGGAPRPRSWPPSTWRARSSRPAWGGIGPGSCTSSSKRWRALYPQTSISTSSWTTRRATTPGSSGAAGCHLCRDSADG